MERRTFTVHYVRDGRSSHFHCEALDILGVMDKITLSSVAQGEVVCIMDDDCEIEARRKDPYNEYVEEAT